LISNAPTPASGNKLKVFGGIVGLSAAALLLFSGGSSSKIADVKNETTTLIDFPVLNLDDRSDLP